MQPQILVIIMLENSDIYLTNRDYSYYTRHPVNKQKLISLRRCAGDLHISCLHIQTAIFLCRRPNAATGALLPTGNITQVPYSVYSKLGT